MYDHLNPEMGLIINTFLTSLPRSLSAMSGSKLAEDK